MELENMTTADLIAAIDGGVYDNADIVEELQLRAIPSNYTDTTTRGGLFPTRHHL